MLNPPCSLCPGRFWFRLYWFPLKVLYATCYSSLQLVPNIPFYFFFNALLLVLTLMNIYWFLVSGGAQQPLHWLLPPLLLLHGACCLSGAAQGTAGGRRETQGSAWRASPCWNSERDPRGGGDNSVITARLELDMGVNALVSPGAWGGERAERVDLEVWCHPAQPWAQQGTSEVIIRWE